MQRDEHDDIIERLKAQAAAAADGRMIAHESDGIDPSVREQFWRQVVEFETAGTTDLQQAVAQVMLALHVNGGLKTALVSDGVVGFSQKQWAAP